MQVSPVSQIVSVALLTILPGVQSFGTARINMLRRKQRFSVMYGLKYVSYLKIVLCVTIFFNSEVQCFDQAVENALPHLYCVSYFFKFYYTPVQRQRKIMPTGQG
jgi:hypothetical protein